jgi:aldehyde dehydrogenase (NAD+)
MRNMGVLMVDPVHHNWIGGEWLAGPSDIPDINPSDTGDIIGHYTQADEAQARAAVEAAADAQRTWQFSGIQDRFEILDRIGDELVRRRDELGQLLSREEGKTLREGIAEAARAGYIFKFFAGEALRLAGDLLPSTRPGLTVEITREPVGTIGIITPWNFPIAIPAWKIAPALCYGNSVVSRSPGRSRRARVLRPKLLLAVPSCSWKWAARIRWWCSMMRTCQPQ